MCLGQVGLTRKFKKGGGGRWSQRGGLSFQELAEEERAKLRINGESVAELDYHAMHPHLLFSWERKQCPDDFYEKMEKIIGQGGSSRFIAKKITLFAVNAANQHDLMAAINFDKFNETRANRHRVTPKPILYDELKKSGLTADAVVESLRKAHPAIGEYVFSGRANELMLQESDIMTSVLLRLMGLGIAALPIHDSVVAPARHKATVKRVMEEEYRRQMGFDIEVE